MIIESTGKKTLIFRGYMGMSATLILLTITLYYQVSQHKTRHCSLHILVTSKHDKWWPTATQISPLFLQSQVSWLPYCSMALIFIFIFFFSSGPGVCLIPDGTHSSSIPHSALILWLNLNAGYKILLLFSTSWNNSSSSRGNINSVIQISGVHRRLLSELGRPVCVGDALPCHCGKHRSF